MAEFQRMASNTNYHVAPHSLSSATGSASVEEIIPDIIGPLRVVDPPKTCGPVAV